MQNNIGIRHVIHFGIIYYFKERKKALPENGNLILTPASINLK